jgi:hypothetical protein
MGNLREILGARRELRVLLSKYQLGRAHADQARVESAEKALVTLVMRSLEPLGFCGLRDAPSASGFAGFVAAITLGFDALHLFDQPERIYDSLASTGVSAHNLHPMVRSRILDLAGPFESVYARELAND